jgi:hypothetical protein
VPRSGFELGEWCRQVRPWFVLFPSQLEGQSCDGFAWGWVSISELAESVGAFDFFELLVHPSGSGGAVTGADGNRSGVRLVSG